MVTVEPPFLPESPRDVLAKVERTGKWCQYLGGASGGRPLNPSQTAWPREDLVLKNKGFLD